MDSGEHWRPAYQVALDEARRSIDRQKADFEGVRQRAGALVGFGGTLAGLSSIPLGAATGSAAAMILLSMVGFVAVAAAAIFVLWPRTGYFDLRASKILDWINEGDATEVFHVAAGVAKEHDADYERNKNAIDTLVTVYTIGVAGLAWQGLFVMLAIVVH